MDRDDQVIERFKTGPVRVDIDDFWAYLPDHKYIHTVTRQLWPAAAVNGHVPWPMVNGKKMRPSLYLDQHRSVQQMTWHPDYPEIIADRLVIEGGWIERSGARTFSLYRPPSMIKGSHVDAARWRDHLHCIYPYDADHIERWLAQRIQHPGVKINHALVLGGEQGIGKDSLLHPIRLGVGPWNFKEVSPQQMLGRFNPWVRAVVLRVSEGRDLGEVDRYAFYDHTKTYIAAPPETLLCDEKNMREHPVFNVMGVILTTNYKTSGIYLPLDDRRHYVAWSDIQKEEFEMDYWRAYWGWLAAEGTANVVAYLEGLDLSHFDAKAPPPKTEAWHAIVHANVAPEDMDLAELVTDIGSPALVMLNQLVDAAKLRQRDELVYDLTNHSKRRALPHKLERAGYSIVRNPDAKDGLWIVERRRVAIYGRREKSMSDLIREAKQLLHDTTR